MGNGRAFRARKGNRMPNSSYRNGLNMMGEPAARRIDTGVPFGFCDRTPVAANSRCGDAESECQRGTSPRMARTKSPGTLGAKE